MVMIIGVDDLKIKIIEDNDRQAIHISNGDDFEPESLKAWAAMVKPEMIALDIGAYTGLFSIIAAMRGAKAIAFEPMPANHWRLGINADVNKVSVERHRAAVSDYSGTADLHFSRHTPLTTGASLEAGIKGHTDGLTVDVVRIDDFQFANVGAIKIDVELHELSVLKGAMATIRQNVPPMLIETLNDKMRVDILQLLPDYKIAAILDRRNTLFTPK